MQMKDKCVLCFMHLFALLRSTYLLFIFGSFFLWFMHKDNRIIFKNSRFDFLQARQRFCLRENENILTMMFLKNTSPLLHLGYSRAEQVCAGSLICRIEIDIWLCNVLTSHEDRTTCTFFLIPNYVTVWCMIQVSKLRLSIFTNVITLWTGFLLYFICW